MNHQMSDQERDLCNDALQRLKLWAQDTVAKCDADGVEWESTQTVLMSAVIDAMMAIIPSTGDKESFMQLMGKAFDAYHKQNKSLQ
jgi:hypothetical protein